MTTLGLATPPRAARPRVPMPDSRPPPARTPPRPRRSFERIFGWSLAGSIAVHLLLLLISPIFIRVGVPPGAGVVSDPEAQREFGLEMIVAIPSATAPEIPVTETPREQPTPIPVRPVPARPIAPGVTPTPNAVPGDQPRQSARDALRPGYRDPRLYVAPRIFPDLERTDHELYMEHLQARIDAVNDSMRVAANRERRTADWTITDSDGDRWGLSDDGLHLGGVTIPRELIPNPTSTGDNQTIQAGRERDRQREEIRRQEEERQRRETQDERIEASRREREAERTGGGGS